MTTATLTPLTIGGILFAREHLSDATYSRLRGAESRVTYLRERYHLSNKKHPVSDTIGAMLDTALEDLERLQASAIVEEVTARGATRG